MNLMHLFTIHLVLIKDSMYFRIAFSLPLFLLILHNFLLIPCWLIHHMMDARHKLEFVFLLECQELTSSKIIIHNAITSAGNHIFVLLL